jgi:hypothetical protein
MLTATATAMVIPPGDVQLKAMASGGGAALAVPMDEKDREHLEERDAVPMLAAATAVSVPQPGWGPKPASVSL